MFDNTTSPPTTSKSSLQVTPSSSVVSALCMNNTQTPRAAPTSRGLSLSAMANTITDFLFGTTQLPSFLAHYAAFFAGFVTGALTAPALFAYLKCNQCDRSKIRLAVFHIVRLFQHRPDYTMLLQNPQELLMCMEPEVLYMIDKHLTKNEAGEVLKELKRNYAHIAVGEHMHTRLRMTKRGTLKQAMSPYLTAAYAPSPRGFLPLVDTDSSYIDDADAPKSDPTPFIKPRFSSSDQYFSRNDSVADDDEPPYQDLLTSDQKQIHFELEQHGEAMDIDQSEIPLPQPLPPVSKYSCASPCPPTRFSSEPNIFVSRVTTSTPTLPNDDPGYESDVSLNTPDKTTDAPAPAAEGLHRAANREPKVGHEPVTSPHAPQHGSFGLDYTDKELYGSDSSSESRDEDEELQPLPLPPQPPHDNVSPRWLQEAIAKAHANPKEGRRMDTPPPVVRKLQGVKCSGTELSPIQGSPEGAEDLLADGSAAQVAKLEDVEAAHPLPFAHWTTQAELEYSSSPSEDGDVAAGARVVGDPPLHSPPAQATPPVTASPPDFSPEQVNPAEAFQGDNSSPLPPPSPPPSSPRRSSPLADITAWSQRTSSSLTPVPPTTTPSNRGRGLRRATYGVAQVPSLPKTPKTGRVKKVKTKMNTPDTRKTTRKGVFQGLYGK